jgi:hypothetical protein
VRKRHIILVALLAAPSFGTAGSAEESAYPAPSQVSIQEIDAGDGDKAFLPGDFNNDGNIDLIIAEEQHARVILYTNDGTGALTRTAEFEAGKHPSWLAALDFDRDGATDLAIANHEATIVSLLRGDSGTVFDRGGPIQLPIETSPHSHMIAAADLNADGLHDLILDSRDQAGVYVLRGNAQGGFETPGIAVDAGGGPYHGFAVGDINNDGKPDIITPNQNDLGLLLNRSGADIAFAQTGTIPMPSPFAVHATDMNGDNNIDLVAASLRETPGIVVFEGDGTGNFRRMTSVPMAAGARIIATGDVNNDGLGDAVITGWNASITLLMGHADQPYPVQLPTGEIRNPCGAAMADFNGDGRDEVIVGDASSGRVHIYSVDLPRD